MGDDRNEGAEGGQSADPMSEDRFMFHGADVAPWFGVTERTLRRWARRGRFPRTRAGQWDIRDVVAFLRKQAETEADRGGLDDEQRLARAKADLAELHLAERRGQLMPKESVRTSAQELWGRVRQIIEAVQRQCTRKCGKSIGELFGSGLKELDVLVERQRKSGDK